MICVLFYVKASYLAMVQRFNKFISAVTDKSKSEIMVSVTSLLSKSTQMINYVSVLKIVFNPQFRVIL